MTYLYSTLNLCLYTHTVPITYHAIQKLKAELVHPIVCHNHLKIQRERHAKFDFSRNTHTQKPTVKVYFPDETAAIIDQYFLKKSI